MFVHTLPEHSGFLPINVIKRSPSSERSHQSPCGCNDPLRGTDELDVQFTCVRLKPDQMELLTSCCHSHKAMFSPIIHHCCHVQLSGRRGLEDVSSDCVRQLHYELIKRPAFLVSDACRSSPVSDLCRLEEITQTTKATHFSLKYTLH